MTPVSLPVFTDSLRQTALPPPRRPDEGPLSFYACGITPYSPAHIGHGRSFVVFDLMRRVLEDHGFRVDMVRNITDIDDKIIQAAHDRGAPWQDLSLGYAKRNREEIRRLGVADYEEPMASDHISGILSLIKILVDKGHAYVGESGDVLFDSENFSGAPLVRQRGEDLRVGGHTDRVDHSGKRSAADFVLWKQAKPEEPFWPSPWGAGRPGWHIECSAMVEKRFGATLDYHGGGTDLRFPHHQAEIQQSEAAYDRPLAHRWVHHGSVRDENGRKMSKSLGNYVELGDALGEAERLLPGGGGLALRVALLSSLWTKPLDWSSGALVSAASALRSWVIAAANAPPSQEGAHDIRHALSENLNTPQAFAAMHALAARAQAGDLLAAGGLSYGLTLLGIDENTRQEIRVKAQDQEVIPERVKEMVRLREADRAAKRWASADQARQAIEVLGYLLEDSPEGPRIKKNPLA